MIASLRGSAAHVFVADVSAPALSDDDHRHLAKVLRLRDGETVSCSDGAGSWRLCTWNNGGLEPSAAVATEPAPAPELTVAVSPVKGDKTDLVVEKLVEIGIDSIVLLAPVERSVVRWAPGKVDHVLSRYERIARSAAMQSRRVFLPRLTGPVPLETVLEGTAAVAEPGGDAPWDNVTTVVIGPEGGFTERETAAASRRVDLGPHVLRAETAAIVAASRMVAHWRR